MREHSQAKMATFDFTGHRFQNHLQINSSMIHTECARTIHDSACIAIQSLNSQTTLDFRISFVSYLSSGTNSNICFYLPVKCTSLSFRCSLYPLSGWLIHSIPLAISQSHKNPHAQRSPFNAMSDSYLLTVYI